MKDKRSTDPAALCTSIAAGAITIAIAIGPYGFISLVVGLTSIIIVLGYEWDNYRTRLQSLAIAMVLAFSVFLIVASAWDMLCRFFKHIADADNSSFVRTDVMSAVWIAATFVFYTLDRRTQKRKGKNEQGND